MLLAAEMDMVPDGDFPCGTPTALRQTGHCGFDLKARSTQL
jgi:hypothetical protein